METNKSTMVIGSGNTIEEAVLASTDQAVEHLHKGLNLSWEHAYMLASLCVDLKFCQVVNPKMTVRASIPKSILTTESLIKSI